jgi:hypothetical protein
MTRTEASQAKPISIPNRREVLLLFAACAFPLHTWALLMFFHQLPAYLAQMSVWDALAVLAYVMALALIETTLTLGVLVFAAIALPQRVFKDRRPALVALGFLITFVWVIPVHFQNVVLDRLAWNMGLYYLLVAAWVISYLGVLIGLSRRLLRSQDFHRRLVSFLDRLTPLALFYLPIDLLCLLVVIVRNWT